jgi:hypothetical protein
VNAVDGCAGHFSLATAVEAHPAETLVQVTVSARHPSRLVLDFSDQQQVLTDARVLLCGHIGAVELLDLGYTGPLAMRPRLAAGARSKASRRADAARPTTDAGGGGLITDASTNREQHDG